MSESQNQGSDNLNEKQSDVSLTVKEVAQHINESPHVIRNWIRELKDHIQTKKGENNYRYFDNGAIERLLLIKKLSREQGYSLKQIEYFLATGEDPLEPEARPHNEDKILQELQEMREDFKKQEQFNQALLQKLEEQNQYINKFINKRDQQLLETMKEMQQVRIEASAADEGRSFWGKLFNKLKTNKDS